MEKGLSRPCGGNESEWVDYFLPIPLSYKTDKWCRTELPVNKKSKCMQMLNKPKQKVYSAVTEYTFKLSNQ